MNPDSLLDNLSGDHAKSFEATVQDDYNLMNSTTDEPYDRITRICARVFKVDCNPIKSVPSNY